MGFEPMIKVLQTSALPLGYVAWIIRSWWTQAVLSAATSHQPSIECRAGDGIRTRDLLLGKETFYH